MKWKNEKRKLGELVPYAKNPRKMSNKQRKDLDDSLKKFDVVEVPAINTDNQIIAGHQRIASLLKMYGPDYEIDVRVPDKQLTQKEFEEYLIRSNKNIGEFDITGLKLFDKQLLIEAGFYNWEVDFKDFFNTKKAKQNQNELFETDIINKNIICGDAIEDIKTKAELSYDLILTDPPYNLGSVTKVGLNGQLEYSKSSDYLDAWQGLTVDQLDTFFKNANRILKYGGYLILFGIDRQLPIFEYYAIKNDLEQQQSLYWLYNSTMPKGHKVLISKSDEETQRYKNYIYGKAPLKQMIETILVFKKKNRKGIIEDILLKSDEVHPSVINAESINIEEKNGTDKRYSDGRMGFYPSQLIIQEENSEKLDTLKEGFSNMFIKTQYEQGEFDHIIFSPKPSNQERNSGLEKKNPHTTVKPFKLIEEIMRLFMTPTEMRIYVPFCGVCSEVIGVMRSGIPIENIEGCELNPNYYAAGLQRLKYWQEQ